MTTKVLIKNMDEQLYKMLKAKAAILGINVSEAIQQAISLWLNVADSVSDQNYAILKTTPEAIKAFNEGNYVLACDGKYVGFFEDEKKALEKAKEYNKCMISNKNYPRQEVGEWGWSSIALE
ncbi:hypothetical protein [Metallosphaera hakonensis]|uniref:Uncharacterized protein n=2 Tax=Metallosphaera hakonensis TaxID=79601 RepID=A0A2U9IR82_9CREN|nr:hypothetical protein [Metallosphaera hakonensis]AWR98559.1 hypothetical protein DFR87_01290 [Metallosphaera hakonensis JCM 8857 = DSM 7519]